MPRRLALVTLLLALAAAAPALAGDAASAPACPGLAAAKLEQDVPAGAQRFAPGPETIGAFVHIWIESRRSALPSRPDAVTVYAVPDAPLLVAYRARGCVLALLRVERALLFRLLDRRLGWAV